ncbi:hypothetical protein M3G46_03825 [Corynebacterium sanguinis]|uniref:hypothetical protein n=1 Tax=Corynebacterium sanguinis TaxID=2594913 RepID=UPI0021A7DDC1|nr:hypothetical protein [Corynebacterium sanguinis]MCT2251704.1 hypothetical protein [Corynebacterium sanguinis]
MNPIQAQAQVPAVMSGIGPHSFQAIQLYPHHASHPLNREGTAFREMVTCADRFQEATGLSRQLDYVVAAGCVTLNPFLSARLEAEMRRAAGY